MKVICGHCFIGSPEVGEINQPGVERSGAPGNVKPEILAACKLLSKVMPLPSSQWIAACPAMGGEVEIQPLKSPIQTAETTTLQQFLEMQGYVRLLW